MSSDALIERAMSASTRFRSSARRRSATTAASGSVVSAIVARKACTSGSDTLAGYGANGPKPLCVPATATANSAQSAVLVVRGPKRYDAHKSAGMVTKAVGR